MENSRSSSPDPLSIPSIGSQSRARSLSIPSIDSIHGGDGVPEALPAVQPDFSHPSLPPPPSSYRTMRCVRGREISTPSGCNASYMLIAPREREISTPSATQSVHLRHVLFINWIVRFIRLASIDSSIDFDVHHRYPGYTNGYGDSSGPSILAPVYLLDHLMHLHPTKEPFSRAIASISRSVFSTIVREYRKNQEPAVEKLKEPILDGIASAVSKRYQLNFIRQDMASLWFLCKQETFLLDITNQACELFNSSEVCFRKQNLYRNEIDGLSKYLDFCFTFEDSKLVAQNSFLSASLSRTQDCLLRSHFMVFWR